MITVRFHQNRHLVPYKPGKWGQNGLKEPNIKDKKKGPFSRCGIENNREMSHAILCQRCANRFAIDPAAGTIQACPFCGLNYQVGGASPPTDPSPIAPPPQVSPPLVTPPPQTVPRQVPPPAANRPTHPPMAARPPTANPVPRPVPQRPKHVAHRKRDMSAGWLIAATLIGLLVLIGATIGVILLVHRAKSDFSVASNPGQASEADNEFGKKMDFVGLPKLTAGAHDKTSFLTYGWKNNQPVRYDFRLTLNGERNSVSWRGTNSLTPVSTPPQRIFSSDSVEGGEGYGSCFFIHPDGLAVTCEHVVRDADHVRINYDGKWHPAEVVSIDEGRDIALLKVDLKNLPVLPVNPSKDLAIGQNVHVIGYPLNDLLGNTVKFNSGTLAGINDKRQGTEIQLNATVNPGNSGGPIVNQSGQVIGIATALLDGHGIASVAIGIHSQHLEEMCRRNLVKLPYQTAESKLENVELASQATPAVCLVHVKRQFNQRVINFRTSVSTDGRNSGKNRGQLLTDRRGEMYDMESENDLPLVFINPGQIGLEKLGATNKAWQSYSVVMLTIPVRQAQQRDPFEELMQSRMSRIRGLPIPQRSQTTQLKMIPGLESKSYRVTSESGPNVEIEVHTQIQSLVADGEAGSMSVDIKGKLEFDKKRNLVSKSTMQGTVVIDSPSQGKSRFNARLDYQLSDGSDKVRGG